MALHDPIELEMKYIEAKALLNTIRLAVERIDSESLNESGICECIDILERLRSDCYKYFLESTKEIKVN